MLTIFVFLAFGLGGVAIFELGMATIRFWEVACCMVAMPWAVWYDFTKARRRRRDYPDNNFHGLPMLNAVGFNKHGAPILPGTREAIDLEKRRDKERLKLEAQIKKEKNA